MSIILLWNDIFMFLAHSALLKILSMNIGRENELKFIFSILATKPKVKGSNRFLSQK